MNPGSGWPLGMTLVAAIWGGCAATAPSSPPVANVCPPAVAPSGSATSSTSEPVDAGAWSPADASASAKQVAHESFLLPSKSLGEPRRINLYVPPGSTSAAAPLPVLYLLDGGDEEDFPHPGVLAAIDVAIRAGEMAPIAVAGIENTERRRDMTGPTQVEKDKKIAPRVGGSAAFRAFIRDELMPEVERRLGRVGKTAIAGESLAGLFVLETFFLEPAMFDTYVAISPSTWWNDAALARSADAWFQAHPRLKTTLYLTKSGDDDIAEANARLASSLKAHAPRGLTWFYEPRADLRHANVYETVAPGVVRRLWPPSTK